MTHYKRIVRALVDPMHVRRRICFNPDCGGASTIVPGTCSIPIRPNIKPKTRERIRQSVEREGFRNPILLYATAPKVLLLGFGGGRLLAAQDLNRCIPAIVVDYTDDYEGYIPVTPDNWQSFFTDVPEHFVFTDRGIETHYNLERMREGEADPAGLAWATEEDMKDILEESPWLK